MKRQEERGGWRKKDGWKGEDGWMEEGGWMDGVKKMDGWKGEDGWTEGGEREAETRSLQCPPNSCRNLVIRAESSGFRRNDFWQEGLLFPSFRCLIIPAEFGHSGIETGMLCGMHRNGVQRSATEFQLFVCVGYVC